MDDLIRNLVVKYKLERSRLQDAIDGKIEDWHSDTWNKSRFSAINEVICDLEKMLKSKYNNKNCPDKIDHADCEHWQEQENGCTYCNKEFKKHLN